jgi:hypothetical protein
MLMMHHDDMTKVLVLLSTRGVTTMNTHLAGEPVEMKMLVEVQGEETPTSPALPQTLPHISPLQLY